MMAWRDWPYWLRGGIFGLIIALLTLISFSDLIRNINPPKNSNQVQITSEIDLTHNVLMGYFGIIVWVLFFLFVGIIIGLIVGKVKKRNNSV